MAIEVSRRLFLFGSAAALAAAAVPVVDGSVITRPMFTPVPALADYLRREVVEMYASFDPHDGPGRLAKIMLSIRGQPIFGSAMQTTGVLRWRAGPHGAIICRAADTYALEVISEIGLGRVDLTCADHVDEHDPIMNLERHTFPLGMPPTCQILPLNTDNSVEARQTRAIERREQAIRAAAEYADGRRYADDDDGPYVPGTLPTLPWR